MPRQRSAPAPARSSSAASSRPKPASSSSHAPASHPQPTSSYASATPATPHHHAPPPMAAPTTSAPPPAMASGGGGGMLSGLMGSVVTGAAMGTGSAIAHRAVDSLWGPRETKVVHEHAQAAPAPAAAPEGGPCGDRVRAFSDCMTRTNGDMGACDMYFQAMQQCKTQAGFNA